MMIPSRILAVICLLPTVLGCSCFFPPEYSTPLESLCNDYERSVDVFVGRVINASCNCVPSQNDSFYGSADILCLSGNISEYYTSEVVAGATCNVSDITFYGLQTCNAILNKFNPTECPYEGQVFMDCAPLCPTTCSNMGVASPCPRVCVRGCGCPQGMVINEEQKRCVTPSQCPNKKLSTSGGLCFPDPLHLRSTASVKIFPGYATAKACPLVGQVNATCGCPQNCFRPANQSCVELCDGCNCASPTMADYITGKCVQPDQCTACPIDGQVYTECGSSCPRTCDNVNETIICDTSCWRGCECPSGMVIDVERRRCVEQGQCTREPPTIVARTSESGRCVPQYTCPFNSPSQDYNLCQYTMEIMEVFKGDNQVGQTTANFGPDLLTSCGNPENILSVGTAYVLGIGGPCAHYREVTPYSRYPAEHRQALRNNCSAIVPTSSLAVRSTSQSSILPSVNPTSRVDNDSGAKTLSSSNLMFFIIFMLYFL